MTEYKSFLAPYIEKYMKYSEASGGCSDHAKSSIRLFDKYCNEHSGGTASLTQELVDGWCSKRDTESNNSCRARVYPIYDLIKYLRARKLTDAACPEIPRHERCTYIPHAFTGEELKRFFYECDHLSCDGRRPSRNRRMTLPVIFRLLYSTGMRTCEARMLRHEHVDIEHGIINIENTKGHIQHYVVLHDSMAEVMEKYDAAISCLYPQREYFFPGVKKPYHDEGWLTGNFRQIWDSVNSSHAVPYDFRHYYGTFNVNSWVGQGFDFFDQFVYLSKSMGHSTLESTKYYYSLVPVLSEILKEQTGAGMEWILTEVNHEKSR